MIDISKIPEKSELLNDDLRNQIISVFQKMTKRLTLVLIMQPDDKKSIEMASLLLDIVPLSQHLDLECYDINDKNSLLTQLNPEVKTPCTAILDSTHTFTGIRFLGVPGGQELNSLVLAIYNASGPGQPVEVSVSSRIDSIRTQQKINIFISLSCHYCAQTVIAAQHLAAMNSNIHATMIDANLYPDYVKKYSIDRVPLLVFNDSTTSSGEKSMEDILDLLQT